MKWIFCLLISLIFSSASIYSQAKTIKFGSNLQAGHFAKVNGIQLYYETYGSGEPLIMLHGNGPELPQ
jgi:hypothetical protein